MELSTRFSGRRLMTWGNAFAAGVFLGTGLIHLLTEANETWLALGWSFPMAQALAAVGFMTLLLVEHVLMPRSAHDVVHAHSGEALGTAALGALSSSRVPYALLLALSVHSIIAGIALGAQDTAASAVLIFVAILAHKSSAAFALGVSLLRCSLPKARARGLLAIFALSTPAGILTGAALGGLLRSRDGSYFDATFLSLAAGTFIYIAAVDILQDEFLQPGGRLAKWLVAALAVVLTAALSRWV